MKKFYVWWHMSLDEFLQKDEKKEDKKNEKKDEKKVVKVIIHKTCDKDESACTYDYCKAHPDFKWCTRKYCYNFLNKEKP